MIERFATVKIKQLLPLSDQSFPDCFVKTRRLHMQGTVDSPVYTSYNKYWLVKHITSKLVGGVSVGYYGIYHENELEIISAAPVRTGEFYSPNSATPPLYDEDVIFDYKSWDEVPY